MTETVSSLLSMQKALSQRKSQLETVRNSCTTETHYHDPNKTETPTYDIKVVDKKIVRINNALFLIDKKIKESNAKTQIDVDLQFEELMSEM